MDTYGIHAIIDESDDINTILFDLQAESMIAAFKIVHKAMAQLGIKRYRLECQYDSLFPKQDTDPYYSHA